jgi:hypothetical protein
MLHMVKDLINSFTIDLTLITPGDPMLFYQRQLKAYLKKHVNGITIHT